ncbi:D-alanyl-D-alanine carboxypeptidase [Caldanaerobacter subterraneus subsp. pacificus DSM 12653]|uniref:serine-type D-Ala-D-Ala carboxypeptidase n=1 Tax=Caldanaerobacter subterraneus subsp. pacificus DSM 12653 TaxID=391606 RepID=B7R7M6_9THEO|nr:D-alanyl-D-alanine carboxypeptidase family protein [Caldanaerobacter subterraneus]KKC29722.1 D-alanyl-D-alanine carboxypeptidase [Caldanaerobacter subterraneus subsp. pacificus DSM 12653]
MKKYFSLLLILMFFVTFSKVYGSDIPSVSAKAAIVMDQNTGRVLYEKNAHLKLPMASTTKIMTLLIALERGNLNDIVTVSQKAASVGGSSIWLSPGEKIDMESLLYGIMLNSGNDAATAIAEHIGGTVENFVEMMNQKAKEIGAYNTHFVTPSGLDISIDDHYTTAYDLALITRYAFLNYPKFAEIVSTKEKTIPWEGKEWDRYLRNKNKLLWIYEGADGVKTGFTNKAGRCLVSSATREGRRFIAVVLNSPPMWEDSMKILDYAFSRFKPFKVFERNDVVKKVKVEKGKIEEIEVAVEKDCIIPVSEEEIGKVNLEFHIPDKLEAPIKKGEK